jgi:hypothetical protein
VLFRPLPDGRALAISQPAHAWISGQLARAWGGAVAGVDRLPELFILAAEQHDIGWLPWEAAPTRDPATGRPYDFVALPRDQHTALWSAGVATAAASYGPHVALLVSLHGLAIYALTPDEKRAPEDLAAVQRFRAEQEAMQARLRPQVAASDAQIADQRAILLALDLMSLVICGAMGREPRRTPPVPLADGTTRLALAFPGAGWDRLTVDPGKRRYGRLPRTPSPRGRIQRRGDDARRPEGRAGRDDHDDARAAQRYPFSQPRSVWRQ